MNRLKVLHVYKTYYPDTYGGIEQVIYQLCQGCHLHNIKSDVFVLSLEGEGILIPYEDHGVYYNKQLVEIASTPISIKSISKFKEIQERYDIINYHFPFPFMDVLHLLSKTKARTAVTYHSDIVKQKLLGFFYKPLQNYFLSDVDRIIASSPNYLESSPTLRAFAHKTDVIPFGLSDNVIVNDAGRVDYWKKITGEKFFLFVGAFRYYKGLHVLLAAAKKSGYTIVIVGAGPLAGELNSEIANNELHNVIMAGAVDDKDKNILFNLCLAVVFPSHLRSEAFGITLLEGTKFGKPLISCDIGTGTSFINKNGYNGYVIPPEDSDALFSSMKKIWEDEDEAKRLGLNSRQRFEEMFTSDKMVTSYVELYYKLMG